MTELASPYELMADIQRSARALDDGGRALAKTIRELGEAELAYEQEFQKALIIIFDDSKNTGTRLPAEDIRKALAHQKVPKEVYARFLAKKAAAEALKAWNRATESSLSAKQSLLAALREEMRATP